jgi:HSP20 family protein
MNEEIIKTQPRFKTRTHNEGFDLAVALPGVSRDDIEINLEKRVLTITGERRKLAGEFTRETSEEIHYELRVNLHEDLDAEEIKATHQDGVIVLHLRKRSELAPRKIDILSN